MKIKFGKKYPYLRIVGFKYKLKFMWFGAYWENNRHTHWCNIWICFIPAFPFQLAWVYGEQGGYEAIYDKEGTSNA